MLNPLQRQSNDPESKQIPEALEAQLPMHSIELDICKNVDMVKEVHQSVRVAHHSWGCEVREVSNCPRAADIGQVPPWPNP